MPPPLEEVARRQRASSVVSCTASQCQVLGNEKPLERRIQHVDTWLSPSLVSTKFRSRFPSSHTTSRSPITNTAPLDTTNAFGNHPPRQPHGFAVDTCVSRRTLTVQSPYAHRPTTIVVQPNITMHSLVLNCSSVMYIMCLQWDAGFTRLSSIKVRCSSWPTFRILFFTSPA